MAATVSIKIWNKYFGNNDKNVCRHRQKVYNFTDAAGSNADVFRVVEVKISYEWI